MIRAHCAWGVIAVGLAATPAAAQFTTYEVQEATLNRILTAVGPIAGTNGYYSISVPRPCVPDFWHKCWITIASGHVHWTIFDNAFQITSGGVGLQGKVRLEWSGLSYTTTYSTSVTVTFAPSVSTMRLQVTSIHIPIVFLGVTLTTRTFSLPYGVSFPMPGFPLHVTLPSGADRSLSVHPGGVVITTATDVLRVGMDPLID